jgi:hypothetical protein
MRRRFLQLAPGVVVLALVTSSAIQSALRGAASAADWPDPAVVRSSAGLRAQLPRSWYAFGYGDNGEQLVVSSFPISRTWPSLEHKSVPDGGIYIWIFTYGALPPLALHDFPARPARFHLAKKDHGFYECGFGLEGYAVRFRIKGLAVQAMVALGEGADAGDAEALLDRLTADGIMPSLPQA